MNLDKNDFIFLEKPFAPKLILWFYWLSVVLTLIGAVLSMFETQFTFLSFVQGIFIGVFGFLFLRFLMELLLMPFKIEQHLQDLKEQKNQSAKTTESND